MCLPTMSVELSVWLIKRSNHVCLCCISLEPSVLYSISQEPTVFSSVSLVTSVLISVMLEFCVLPWYIAKTECSVVCRYTRGFCIVYR